MNLEARILDTNLNTVITVTLGRNISLSMKTPFFVWEVSEEAGWSSVSSCSSFLYFTFHFPELHLSNGSLIVKPFPARMRQVAWATRHDSVHLVLMVTADCVSPISVVMMSLCH